MAKGRMYTAVQLLDYSSAEQTLLFLKGRFVPYSEVSLFSWELNILHILNSFSLDVIFICEEKWKLIITFSLLRKLKKSISYFPFFSSSPFIPLSQDFLDRSHVVQANLEFTR